MGRGVLERWGLGASLVLTLVAILWTGYAVMRQVGEVNRPDVTRYPTTRAEQRARANGIEVRVERVLFVDQDVDAAIFVAHGVRVDPAMAARGSVVVRPLGRGRSLVGYVAGSGPGGWRSVPEWWPDELARAAQIR